jgi:hypothetical protein
LDFSQAFKMRTAYYNQSILRDDDGRFFGLNLGHDYCFEHEDGIAGIEGILGVPGAGNGLGIGARQQSKVPSTENVLYTCGRSVYSTEGRKRRTLPWAVLLVASGTYEVQFSRKNAEKPARRFRDLAAIESLGNSCAEWKALGLDAAWGRNGFRVRAVGKVSCEMLARLHAALMAGALCVSLSGSANPFAGSGLCLTVASLVPEELKAAVLAADEDHARLVAAAKASGVEAALEAAGREYYALMPGWADSGRVTVWFFLNPREQSLYNHGWFSAQDLFAWAKGEGPVVKARAAA